MSNTKEMMRRITELDKLESDLNLLDMAFSIDNETEEPKIELVTVTINSNRGAFTIYLDCISDLKAIYNLCYAKVQSDIDTVNDQLNKLLGERLKEIGEELKEKND